MSREATPNREREPTWMPLGVVSMVAAVGFMGYVVVSHERPHMPRPTVIEIVPSAQQ